MKKYLTLILLLLPVSTYAQDDKYKPEEIKDFYRQVKLTTEYKQLQKSVDSNNAWDKLVPQEVKFIIEHHRTEGIHYEKEKNLLHGFLHIYTELGVTSTAYRVTYDRAKKKITSIKHSGEVNPTRHNNMEGLAPK